MSIFWRMVEAKIAWDLYRVLVVIDDELTLNISRWKYPHVFRETA